MAPACCSYPSTDPSGGPRSPAPLGDGLLLQLPLQRRQRRERARLDPRLLLALHARLPERRLGGRGARIGIEARAAGSGRPLRRDRSRRLRRRRRRARPRRARPPPPAARAAGSGRNSTRNSSSTAASTGSPVATQLWVTRPEAFRRRSPPRPAASAASAASAIDRDQAEAAGERLALRRRRPRSRPGRGSPDRCRGGRGG